MLEICCRNLVEQLLGGGAEAIQVGDVRVVAGTWLEDTTDGISVSGSLVQPPYVIRAIGDANTLAGAMQIPGGVTATVRRVGAQADVEAIAAQWIADNRALADEWLDAARAAA